MYNIKKGNNRKTVIKILREKKIQAKKIYKYYINIFIIIDIINFIYISCYKILIIIYLKYIYYIIY